MPKISIVFSGTKYKEFDIYYQVKTMKNLFPDSEIILSSNDKMLLAHAAELNIFDIIVPCLNVGELPSLKFPNRAEKEIINNNIKKQIDASFAGIKAATNDLVLKLRTDQLLLNSSILNLWDLVKSVEVKNRKHKGRIITSSTFSINPRYSERMAYHISDMLQFGYKDDLLNYYSAPEYPFYYAVWYEFTPHAVYSNANERLFRSRYAVEQWLALHYIYGSEEEFPIKYHNDISPAVIEDFESIYTDYFVIAHPIDIGLRASKFTPNMSYVNNQCYSTFESLRLLEKNNGLTSEMSSHYKPKGINKKTYRYIKFVLDLRLVQLMIKIMPGNLKTMLKRMIS